MYIWLVDCSQQWDSKYSFRLIGIVSVSVLNVNNGMAQILTNNNIHIIRFERVGGYLHSVDNALVFEAKCAEFETDMDIETWM